MQTQVRHASSTPYVHPGVVSSLGSNGQQTWTMMTKGIPVPLPLANYSPVGLGQLQKLLYTNRIDTKYVFNTSRLPAMLSQLHEAYHILQIGEERAHPYTTIYFDTQDLALYRHHHNGKLRRYKIRSRQYGLTGVVFNEVKCKTNRRRTLKTRIRRDTLSREIDSTFADFIAENWSAAPHALVLSLEVTFNRITLVDRAFTERITIDTGLTYSFEGAAFTLPSLAIAEVKRQRHTGHSAAAELFRGHRLSCSKYCLGITNMRPRIKANNFKPMLRTIGRITGQPRSLRKGTD